MCVTSTVLRSLSSFFPLTPFGVCCSVHMPVFFFYMCEGAIRLCSLLCFFSLSLSQSYVFCVARYRGLFTHSPFNSSSSLPLPRSPRIRLFFSLLLFGRATFDWAESHRFIFSCCFAFCCTWLILELYFFLNSSCSCMCVGYLDRHSHVSVCCSGAQW